MSWFRNETAPACLKDTKHFCNRAFVIRNNGENSRCYQDIKRFVGSGQSEGVHALERAVLEIFARGPLTCGPDLTVRAIDSDHANLRKALRQLSRIKSRSAPKLNNPSPRLRIVIPPKRRDDAFRIV